MMRIFVGVVCGVILSSWSDVDAKVLEGVIVSVTDGDTVVLLVGKTSYKIRLLGIDAPETRPAQAYGQVAKQRLAELVFQQPVVVLTTTRDRYQRWLGVILLRDGRVVNHVLTDEGYAWVYTSYNTDPVLVTLEVQARAAKRGLWGQGAEPVAPWEFRRQKVPKVSGPQG